MRILHTICLLAVGGVSLIFWSCVDTPSQGQLPPDYRALTRFVHVATDAASGQVTVDGNAVGTLSFGEATGYLDLPAGGREFGFASATKTVPLRSNSQNTILIYPLTGTDRFLSMDEGYSFTNNSNGQAGIAQIRFMHVAKGSAPAVSFKDSSATGTVLKGAVPFATGQGYTNVSAGTHAVYVTSDGGYEATINGSQSVPTVNTRTTGTGTFDIAAGGMLSYSITLQSDVRDSLYTAAHFHFGAAGVGGPVAKPIDVSSQKITFPEAEISGEYEVPPDTTVTASGTGSFTFTQDGLEYSITVTKGAGLDDRFIAAHFHNASAGTIGPVVRTIATGSPFFGDTTIIGTWKPSDSEPLTPALVTQLLTGRIYVNFLTPGHGSGAIRAQLIPDSLSTNTFSGTWAIPDSAIDSVVAGHVYVNFHDQTNPGGRVRGQLVVDPAKGDYGIASMPAADFLEGRMYTIIATGVAKTLGLHQFSDRQFGLSKQIQTVTSTPRVRE
ncbi:MAG: CHRD domain-containing protein [Ignavibacteriae bacterium]|nr:CHRD domain-containing protein [Ignavibacteria bacterium]MBI3364159.1 CHRD domain-containing protein [Ignavibacteriota bacterium]